MIKQLVSIGLGGALLAGCGGGSPTPAQNVQTGNRQAATPAGGGLSGDAQRIAQERDLTPDDVTAALKTYMPTGRHDEYLIFSSGGHSGQVLVIGIPSMRLLRVIGVFTPEPWQGWGYGVGEEILAEGEVNGKPILWADTHHPALSETNGEFDGQFLFINDKANARVAVIDLRDWETKQILKNPIALNDHGGTFVTPNTEYVIEGGQYAQPLGWEYAPIEDYNDAYRGMVTFWKFDRNEGRIDPDRSFALELPPYWQDLFDAGKGASEGWIFGNSFNTELATGGIEKGNAPFEAGASQRDADYLHIIDMAKAEAAYSAGQFERVNGFPVISLQTCIDNGILFFAPEPKSPHGVDVTPNGEFLVVSGKLDPHVTIYSFDRIQQTIAAQNWAPDQYGVPVLDFDSVVEAQVEVGLGPLHTQFDDKGYAYTSLFLDTAVARWTLGGPYASLHPEPAWQKVGNIGVHYNVGHIGVAEGDTMSPDGKYLVAFNKWSLDRFFPTGPLLPQNFQLIDISEGGDRMQLLTDMPIGIGEPHYAQIVKADKIKPWLVYPEIGWDPQTQAVRPGAPVAGEERIVRTGSTVEVFMTAVRSHFKPEHVTARRGDHIIWHITNIERAQDATHGFALPGYNINVSLEPGETLTVEFDADQPGTYTFYCSEFCSALHLEMAGYFLVEP
ncbi:MAG: Sec-dependent nitrous-oxide reductase [Planctomycetota bacterium]|jgi:nitrous-oxide reductase